MNTQTLYTVLRTKGKRTWEVRYAGIVRIAGLTEMGAHAWARLDARLHA